MPRRTKHQSPSGQPPGEARGEELEGSILGRGDGEAGGPETQQKEIEELEKQPDELTTKL